MKKIISLGFVIIGILLVGGGILLMISNNPIEKKELRKILPSELDNDNAKEIIQYYLDEYEKDQKWDVTKTTLIATDNKDGFLVNVEAKKEGYDWYRQTVITYKDDKWDIKLPMWSEGSEDVSQYTSFYGVEE